MTASAERRRQDLGRLESLCASSGGRLLFLSRKGDPAHEFTIEIRCRTAGSDRYPAESVARSSVRISLPARYPFDAPTAEVLTPAFHPNVYPSGRICFGTRWLPTEGLDLLVRRIGQILTFDPAVLNVGSPANPTAVSWYLSVRARNPQAFPTDTLGFLRDRARPAAARWRDLSAPAAVGGGANTTARIVRCPRCGQQVRVQTRAGVLAICPRCRERLAA